ncbi:hypothetical protein [Pseudomonas sp. dw_358]|uniref:hypothetical protein n=1 Tax=Pseudomonas sp. dw_358 TaxID=2720083 RepID=UPI001BD6C122|nr:hypothetical protein [Pseudomonas sp. dw_358]
MNSYDSEHLRLLNLIEARRWSEIGQDDLHALKVLMVCNYVVLTDSTGKDPVITLNPEGQDYFQHLSRLKLQNPGLVGVQAAS